MWNTTSIDHTALSGTETVDHILSFDKGGTHTPDNVLCCYRTCNSPKNNKDVEEWYRE